MARQTSELAYRTIQECGLLSELRFAVYDVLYQYGPMTAHETWHKMKELDLAIIKDKRDGITQRFSELKRLGVIGELGKRQCSYTSMVAIEWDVTANLPADLKSDEAKIATQIDRTEKAWERFEKEQKKLAEMITDEAS